MAKSKQVESSDVQESVEVAVPKTYKNPSEPTEIVIIKSGEGMQEGEIFNVGIQVADVLVSRGFAKIVE
jgi:hypothetical protein